jgi:hypothetical protein
LSARLLVTLALQAVGPDPDQGQAWHRSTSRADSARSNPDVLAGIVSNKGNGETIYLSENTVKFHQEEHLLKLAVCTRLQTIMAATSDGPDHN